MEPMQVEISSVAQERLKNLVRLGVFASIDEAIEAAVRELPLEDSEIDWEALRAVHERGIAEIEAGLGREVTPEFLAELRRRVTPEAL